MPHELLRRQAARPPGSGAPSWEQRRGSDAAGSKPGPRPTRSVLRGRLPWGGRTDSHAIHRSPAAPAAFPALTQAARSALAPAGPFPRGRTDHTAIVSAGGDFGIYQPSPGDLGATQAATAATAVPLLLAEPGVQRAWSHGSPEGPRRPMEGRNSAQHARVRPYTRPLCKCPVISPPQSSSKALVSPKGMRPRHALQPRSCPSGR